MKQYKLTIFFLPIWRDGFEITNYSLDISLDQHHEWPVRAREIGTQGFYFAQQIT